MSTENIMEFNSHNCNVCYRSLYSFGDVYSTICNHKFHTKCLLRFGGNQCPLCLSNLVDYDDSTCSSSSSIMATGKYSAEDYLNRLKINNVSISSCSKPIQNWLNEYRQNKQEMKKLEEKYKEMTKL